MCHVHVGINIIVDSLEEAAKEEDAYFFWNLEMKGFTIIVISMIIYVSIIFFFVCMLILMKDKKFKIRQVNYQHV